MLGDRIRELRMAREITQVELAESAGINRSYLSVIENNHSSPTMEIMERIAIALGINLIALVSEVEEKHYIYDTEEEYEMPEGLTDFLNDNEEIMLTRPTSAEIEELKQIVFRGATRPDKRFFRDALLAIRRGKQ